MAKLQSSSLLKIAAIIIALPTIGMTGCSDKSDNPRTIDPPPIYPSYDILATWLPSGNGILFWGSEPVVEDGNWGLMLHSFDDSSTTVLLPGVAPLSIAITPDERWISLRLIDGIYNWSMEDDSSFRLPLPSDAYNVDWSPDGQLIAYDTPGGSDRGVYIQNIETGERKKLRAYARDPSWFMDGERLAIRSFEFGGGDSELAIVDTNGNMLIRLTDDNAILRDIDVSPDGNWIVMILKFEQASSSVYIVSTEGGDARRLCSVAAKYPSFSPDGEWIAFTNISDDGRIWLVRPDGTDLCRLTDSRQ